MGFIPRPSGPAGIFPPLSAGKRTAEEVDKNVLICTVLVGHFFQNTLFPKDQNQAIRGDVPLGIRERTFPCGPELARESVIGVVGRSELVDKIFISADSNLIGSHLGLIVETTAQDNGQQGRSQSATRGTHQLFEQILEEASCLIQHVGGNSKSIRYFRGIHSHLLS